MTINSLKTKATIKSCSEDPLSFALKHQNKSPLKKLKNKGFSKNQMIGIRHVIFQRFANHVQNDDQFFILVSSKSDKSPSYLISTNDYNKKNTPIFFKENDSEEICATTPKGTKLYPRSVAVTGSGNKSLTVLSPTPPAAPKKSKTIDNKSKAAVCKNLFGNNSISSKQETCETLENSCALQCSSPNKQYLPRLKSISQKSIMKGNSASEAVKEAAKQCSTFKLSLPKEPIDNEWCHLLAYSYSQFSLSPTTSNHKKSFIPQSAGNLIAATRFLNTKMIVLENATNYLLKNLPSCFSLIASTECDIIAGSNNVMCNTMRQKISVIYKGKPIFSFQQTIEHDFGLRCEDRKRLAAIKDLTAINAFIINELQERLKDPSLLESDTLQMAPKKK